MQRKLLFFAVMILTGSLLISCKEDVVPPPTITSFTPTSGAVGSSVTITGTNFDPTPANNVVMFNGTAAVVTASTATSISTSVPTGANTGTITVTVGGQTATSSTSFTVIPAISSFNPTSGVVGTSVTITGTNFDGTAANNTVKFNGTTAVVTASTATSITTSVPTGATTGPITVTVGGQTATSATSIRIDALFVATMNGASESDPNPSTATGTSTLIFNLETKIFTVVTTYTGLSPTAGHIHKGAVGVAGSVVFPFSNVGISPINYTSAALTAAQEADLNAELYYSNLHTPAYPAGEIRGQLLKQ